MNPLEIQQIGRYPVEQYVAEGGMSWVFRVRDPSLFDAPRALKLVKPHATQGAEFERFLAEARLLSTLQHANLIRVYEFGQDEASGLHFYTMDFVEGCTLDQVPCEWLAGAEETVLTATADSTQLGVAQGPQRASLADVCHYTIGVASALARLHRQGVIHRDVKPGNIFVNSDGNAVLGDLGIAKSGQASAITQVGFAVGTPLYMSPEQAMGQPASPQSDLFSLGLTLYRVLAGRSVYEGADGVDASNSQHVIAHLVGQHQRGREFDFAFPKAVPEALREVVRVSTRLDPARRYRSADEMGAALTAVLPFLGSAREVRVAGRGPGLKLAAGAAALAALVVLAVVGMRGWSTSDPEEAAPAQHEERPPLLPAAGPEREKPPGLVPFGAGSTSEEVDAALRLCEQFASGCKREWYESEVFREVYLPSFQIDVVEVTNAQFAQFVDAASYETDAERRGFAWRWTGFASVPASGFSWRHPNGPGSSHEDQLQYPVRAVSWNDADAYCRWSGGRLPTEDEWEYAARGRERRIFPWGNEWEPRRVGWATDGPSPLREAGALPDGATPQGIRDLAGSLWEWTSGSEAGDKVLKGGSYVTSNPANLRAAARRLSAPEEAQLDDGFRCVTDTQ